MSDENDTSDNRRAEFRLLAETAQRLAEKADSKTAREDYLRIAADWAQLADEIENSK